MRIAQYTNRHRESIVELSLRAWAGVFPKLQANVPDFVYAAFYPEGWQARQAADVRAVLDNEPETVDLALDDDDQVAGWVATRIHPEDRMGEIHMIAVDPDRQGQGLASRLMERASERSHQAGMTMLMVETGDDPGHARARASYEAAGFEQWPVARYFKKLS